MIQHTHAEQYMYCYCICAKNLDFLDKEYNTHIENVIDRFNISFSVSKFLKTKRYVVYGKYVRYLKKADGNAQYNTCKILMFHFNKKKKIKYTLYQHHQNPTPSPTPILQPQDKTKTNLKQLSQVYSCQSH